jgi:hypothetical protein
MAGSAGAKVTRLLLAAGTIEGRMVPHRLSASWIVDDRPMAYVDFRVEHIELDVAAPFEH